MTGWAILIAAATAGAVVQPLPPQKVGTITTDANITCAQMRAFFERMAKASNDKIKPMPCHEKLPAATRNQIRRLPNPPSVNPSH
jgi:hypothetical protein